MNKVKILLETLTDAIEVLLTVWLLVFFAGSVFVLFLLPFALFLKWLLGV